MLMFALTLYSCLPDRAPPVESSAGLGWQRCIFGDYVGKAVDPLTLRHYKDWCAFNCTYSKAQTEMIFPSGRADLRYYVNSGGLPKLHSWWALQCESKRKGTVHIDWVVFLKLTGHPLGASLPEDLNSAGTMRKLLFERGVQVVGPVASVALAALDAKAGLTIYWRQTPVSGLWEYQYMDAGGRRGREYEWDPWRGRRSRTLDWPNIDEPYPIPPEEAADCRLR